MIPLAFAALAKHAATQTLALLQVWAPMTWIRIVAKRHWHVCHARRAHAPFLAVSSVRLTVPRLRCIHVQGLIVDYTRHSTQHSNNVCAIRTGVGRIVTWPHRLISRDVISTRSRLQMPVAHLDRERNVPRQVFRTDTFGPTRAALRCRRVILHHHPDTNAQWPHSTVTPYAQTHPLPDFHSTCVSVPSLHDGGSVINNSSCITSLS